MTTRTAILSLVLLAAAASARHLQTAAPDGGQPQADPAKVEPSPEDFARLFKPKQDLSCFGDFPEGFVFVGKTDEDYKKMRSLIWLDGMEREHIPVSENDPQAAQARCYAAGPHRGLNVTNWCCRSTKKSPDGGRPDAFPGCFHKVGHRAKINYSEISQTCTTGPYRSGSAISSVTYRKPPILS